MTRTMKILASFIVLLSAIGVWAGTSNYKHLMLVTDGTVPTFSYATADGEIGTEGDIECQGNLYADQMGFLLYGATIKNDTNNEIEFAEGSEDISLGFGTSNTVILTSDTGVVGLDLAAVGTTLTLANDQTIVSDTDNEIQIGDNSEDISFGFGTGNTCDLSSDTGVVALDLGAVGTTLTFAQDQTLGTGTAEKLTWTENSEDFTWEFKSNEIEWSSSTGVVAQDFGATGTTISLANGQSIVSDTNEEIQIGDTEDISFGFGTSNTVVLSSDTGVNLFDPGTLEMKRSSAVSVNFALEGAGKGLALLQIDGTAYDTTADVINHVYYNKSILAYTTITTAAGTSTPATEATGMDVSPGMADNDAVGMWGGDFGTSGAYFTPGTDAAFKLCVNMRIHDVSGTDELYVGFRTAGEAAVDPITSYTDYCAIGNVSGDIKVNDKTTGPTDTTDNWADDATKELCILVSAAGACTYTIAGAAPAVTDAHTLGDGVPVKPFFNMRADGDLPDDTHIIGWVVSYQ